MSTSAFDCILYAIASFVSLPVCSSSLLFGGKLSSLQAIYVEYMYGALFGLFVGFLLFHSFYATNSSVLFFFTFFAYLTCYMT